MTKITESQYEFALHRIEQLLPMVTDETPRTAPEAVELTLMSDVVIEYEKEHFPIERPTVGELILSSLEDQTMTQRQLAMLIGVSPSRISDYIAGRSEPTLPIARSLCKTLHIAPAAMLGL